MPINVVITVNPIPNVTATPTAQTICSGSNTGISLTSNVIGTTFAWTIAATGGVTGASAGSGNSIAQTLTNAGTTAGTITYTITPTANTCVGLPINVVITVNPIPNVDAGLPQTICITGSATLTAIGTGTYLWNTGLTTQSITVSPSATSIYTVTVTNLGCSAMDTVSVLVSPSINVQAGLPQTICSGQSATLTATGGTTYQWSSGESTQSIIVKPTSNKTYYVTAYYGVCTGIDSVVVSVNPLPIANAGTDQIICKGLSANLTAFGGGTYLWSNGSTNKSINVSPKNDTTYIVTVTLNGCSASDDVNITVNNLPSANAGNDVSICAGNNTILNASGGSSYVWLPITGLSDPNIPNPVANPVNTTTYYVTVTDSNGCSAIDFMNLTVNKLPIVSAGQDQNICFGQNTNLLASGGNSYVWHPAYYLSDTIINNPIASPTSNISYTVTATDVNGCSASDNMVITVNPVPTSTFTLTSPICLGENSTINYTGSGATGSTYNWNFNGGNIITGSGQGPYQIGWNTSGNYNISLSVTQNNCTSPVTNVQQIVGQVTANLTVIDSIKCFGMNNGQVIVTANGAPQYQYSWSNKQNTQTATNLSPNTLYFVTVTDANGCTTSKNITLSEPSQLSMIFSTKNVKCFGDKNGTAFAQVSGGTKPYTYSWLPAGTAGNVNSVNSLSAGTYTLTVKDKNGCEIDTTFTITQAALLTYSTTTKDTVSCNAGSDGFICINPTGGTLPYNYKWNPSISTSNCAMNISAGSYYVTVTDSNGCKTTFNSTIYEPLPITLTTSGNVVICNGQNTTISALASGGTGPYTYSWDNGLGNNSSNLVSPITTTIYNVTVTDANSCTAKPQSLTVSVSPPISVSVTANPGKICFGDSVKLTANPTGGNNNYIYTWGQGIGVSSQSIIVSPSTTTTYPVTVSDNCASPIGIDSVKVLVFPLPNVLFTANPLQGCAPLNVNFTDNSTPAISSWLWNFGDASSAQNDYSTLQNPYHNYNKPGNYSVSLTVTSTEGCVNSYLHQNMIKVYPDPVAQFSFDPPTTSIANPEIFFHDESTYSNYWSWNFGDTSSILDNSSSLQNPYHNYTNPGEYNILLIVTSPNGCTDSVIHQVKILTEFTFYMPNSFTPNGDGTNDFFFPKGEGWDFNNYQFSIFDRWGEQIFTANDPNKYWDGRDSKGNEIVQDGVYVWTVSVKDIYYKNHYFNGRVTLLKK